MLTIRLQRRGRKNDPSFRVILVESKRAAKTGNFQEVLGSYDPRTDRIELKAERIKHWMGMGATVSDTVHNILISQKVIEGKKINVLPRKSPPKKEEAVADSSATAAAATIAATAGAGDAEDVHEAADAATDAPADAAPAATTTDSGVSVDAGSSSAGDAGGGGGGDGGGA